jgi:hypothetical protein
MLEPASPPRTNLKGVIAPWAGDALLHSKYTVTHSEKAPFIKWDKFGAVTDTVLLHLNCKPTIASAARRCVLLSLNHVGPHLRPGCYVVFAARTGIRIT